MWNFLIHHSWIIWKKKTNSQFLMNIWWSYSYFYVWERYWAAWLYGGLTNGNPHSQGCCHQTTGGGPPELRGSVQQLRDPLQDAAQSSDVVDAPKSTACERDVPLRGQVHHSPSVSHSAELKPFLSPDPLRGSPHRSWLRLGSPLGWRNMRYLQGAGLSRIKRYKTGKKYNPLAHPPTHTHY